MSESKKKFGSWDEVIMDFFKRKKDAEEEKYLKERIKSIGKMYKDEGISSNSIDLIFDAKRNKRKKDETPLEFQQRRAREILELDVKPGEFHVYQEKRGYLRNKRNVLRKFNPKEWFSRNCKNASSVSFATHVAKLTHSKIDTPSLFDSTSEQKERYLTTSSLKEKIIDGAVAGNQFAPIFQFLELEHNGMKLAEVIKYNDDILNNFSDLEDEENLTKEWISGFRQSLESANPATHALAKQIYFPVGFVDKGGKKYRKYHLLVNMVSSSLAQCVFDSVFNASQKPVRKLLDNHKYTSFTYNKYSNRSHIRVTANNHSNASQLNAKRAGKLHLFSSQPPTWQSQLKPPVNRRSLFDAIYNSTIKTELEYLRDFLLRFKRLDLSIKNPKRKQHLERWVENIIDECLFYIGSIQNLPVGWSEAEHIRLKPEHQYLLDPYRPDEAFQASRQNTDWQAVVRADFAQWMNWQLRGKDKQFTPMVEHTRLWKKLFEQPLREHMEPIEQDIKQVLKEVV